MGALISREHRDKVVGFIRLAQSEGLEIRCGHDVDPLILEETNQKVGWNLECWVSDPRQVRRPCLRSTLVLRGSLVSNRNFAMFTWTSRPLETLPLNDFKRVTARTV